MPALSLITPTRNAAATLPGCIASIASQTLPCEYIIVDGGSTDDTVGIAQSAGVITKWISEPDRGIFDAMNKGIGMATGEVVGILNADDFYASPDVLEKVAKVFHDAAVDSCYGDLEYVDAHDTAKVVRYWKSGPFSPSGFYWGWMPPHPAFFVRRSVYEKHGLFNLEMGLSADYELMLRFLVKHAVTTAYIPEVLVKMRVGGKSNESLGNRLSAHHLARRAWEVNGLRPYPWTLLCKPLRKIPQWFLRRHGR